MKHYVQKSLENPSDLLKAVRNCLPSRSPAIFSPMSTMQFLSALAAFDTLRRNSVVQIDVQHRNIMFPDGVPSHAVIIDFGASLVIPDCSHDSVFMIEDIQKLWALCEQYDPLVAVVRQWRLRNYTDPMVEGLGFGPEDDETD
jgi:hypothetical protein